MKKQEKLCYGASFKMDYSDEAIKKEETKVLLWDLCNKSTLEHISGNTIDEFFKFLKDNKKSATIFFHKFSDYIDTVLTYMEENDYKHTTLALTNVRYYKTLINGSNVCYGISFKIAKNAIITINDSKHKINSELVDIDKDFKLNVMKKYKLEDDKDYHKYYSEIIATSMDKMYENGMTGLTGGSDSLNSYKKSLNGEFEKIFTPLEKEIDDFIRKSYSGGSVYLNPSYQGKLNEDEKINVFDINSSYPGVMCESLLPYGRPEKFKGKYKKDDSYPLYIVKVKVELDLKENHLPTLMKKQNGFNEDGKVEYITSTEDAPIELHLNNVDLELMYIHYNIHNITFLGGYKFHGSTTLFKDYIMKIYEQKLLSVGAKKQLYKILLNALYGKFGKKTEDSDRIPYIEDGVIKYKKGEVKITKSVYTAMSSFISSYGRAKLYDAIHKNIKYFVYCDTDSIHLTTDSPIGIEINNTKLGAWKLEKVYTKSKYLGQKIYMGECEDGKLDIKVAGCQKGVKKYITFENFEYGNSYPGHILTKVVKGGKIKIPAYYTLLGR